MTVRIVQIGAGIRGRHWAAIVRDRPDLECVAFVDPDPAALAKVRAIAGDRARYLTDFDQTLAEARADAALIASPSALHAEHAVRALEANLAVMVEKPFALTVEQASRVLEQAEKIGKPIMVAENYRFWPSERTVRRLVQEGRIGQVASATLVDRRHMPSHTEGPWLRTIEFPQLQEIAIHHFDSLRCFFDRRPTAITVNAWNPPWSDYQSGASTEALLDLDGIRVQYVGTLLSHRFAFSLWIEGERGVLWTNRKYVFWRPRGSRFFRPVRADKVPPGDEARYPRGGTASLLNGLRDAVLRGTVPETSGHDNIWNVAMVQAGKLSQRERRTVQIAEVYPAAAGLMYGPELAMPGALVNPTRGCGPSIDRREGRPPGART